MLDLRKLKKLKAVDGNDMGGELGNLEETIAEFEEVGKLEAVDGNDWEAFAGIEEAGKLEVVDGPEVGKAADGSRSASQLSSTWPEDGGCETSEILSLLLSLSLAEDSSSEIPFLPLPLVEDSSSGSGVFWLVSISSDIFSP